MSQPNRPPPLPRDMPRALVGDEQPERAAVHHPGVDGAPQPKPARTGTLPGLPATRSPPLPPELAPTYRVPPSPPLTKTWRLPTPPSAARLARRTDPPAGSELSESSDAPQSLQDGQEAALRVALAKERARVAELERDARAAAEARLETYPPKVTPAPAPAPAAKSSPPDEAIGKSIRYLLGKLWPLFFAAAGIGGGVTAVAKPSADPAKADATLANLEAVRADVSLIRDQISGMLKREATRDMYVRCLEESLDEVGEQLLPARDRLTNSAPLRAYVKRCQRLRP